MIFSAGESSQASRRGCAPSSGAPLMLDYLTEVRGERVVIVQVNWISCPKQA
jgi:hypothetical protein